MGLIKCSGARSLRRGLTELRGPACARRARECPCVSVNAGLLVGFLQGLLWS